MTSVLRLSGGNDVGDLELTNNKQNKNYESREDCKRSYTCCQNLGNYTAEYCNISTINGLHYFGENRTCIEKIWWAISITLSLYFCISLVISAYTKWDTSPVIVSFATKETSVWMFPFPAVTICPESKTRSSAFNYSHYYYKKQDDKALTEEEERKFGYLSFICDANPDLKYTSGKFADERMLDFFEEVQPNFYKNVFDCKYLGEKQNCSDIFVPVITDDGICYTFNILDRSQILSDVVYHHKHFHQTTISNDWTIETGYHPTAGRHAYPRRALFAGVPFALEITLKVHVDDIDYTCGSSLKGWKVQIAHPQKMPRVKQQHFILPPNRIAKAGIAPVMMTTSNEVRQYRPKRRKCFFSSERRLKYYTIFTQNNCAIECRANYTMSHCGCVPFYMPSERDVPICGPESHRCIKDAISKLQHGSIQKRINAMNNIQTSEDKEIPNCLCLPDCTSLSYNVENTQAPWDWTSSFKYIKNPKVNISDKKIRMSKLQVYFTANQFISSERNELYGSTEFLANVGGLLGLFIGFSALTVVEVIYYLTLRIICNISMFGRRNWSGKID